MNTTNRIPITAIISLFLLGLFLDAFAAGDDPSGLATTLPESQSPSADEGIRFTCAPDNLGSIKAGMDRYLTSLGIAPDLVVEKLDQINGILVFTLNTPKDDFDTLRIKDRPEFAILDSVIHIPDRNGKTRKVVTVSRKEILLALLQHGRLTEFSAESCNIDALKELVGIRQNIVAWSENLNWVWPDGGAAKWNTRYWHRGTPLPGVPLHAAFGDAFKNQKKYSIGCYTATKLVVVQGVLDYYRRVKNNPDRLKQVEARLVLDHDPLVNVEPGKMWSFEKDFDPGEFARPGKILHIQYGISPKNFVPGDWIYLLNNDPVSSNKTGYEGSNAIYLGRNKFDDYYNDNRHSYTYEQKLDEVYQWRNGVFNRSRDAAKIRPLSGKDIEQLGKPPSEGGITMNFRVFPYLLSHREVAGIRQPSLPPDQVSLSRPIGQ